MEIEKDTMFNNVFLKYIQTLKLNVIPELNPEITIEFGYDK